MKTFFDWGNKLLIFLLNYVLQPTFFISFFGPLIIGYNYFMVVNLLKSNNTQIQVAADNPYTYALISYHIQYFVLIFAFVFFMVEIGKVFLEIFTHHSSIGHLKSHIKNKDSESFLTKIVVLFSVILLYCTITAFAKNTFARVNLDLYLKKYEKPFLFLEEGLPPWVSITQFRVAFVLYGITLSFWKERVLNKILAPKPNI